MLKELKYNFEQAQEKFKRIPKQQQFIIAYIFATIGFLIGLFVGGL